MNSIYPSEDRILHAIFKRIDEWNTKMDYDIDSKGYSELEVEKNIDVQIFKNALKQYVYKRDKNLHKLMEYAGVFHVEKILK